MRCQEVMEYMQRYLDKDLKEAEVEELNEHLKECPDCCVVFERLKQLSDELVLLPKVVPPVSLVDSIMPQLEQMDQIHADLSAKNSMIRLDGTAVAANRPIFAWKNWFGKRLSFQIAGGVVALGIAFGVFVVSQPSPSMQNADAILPKQASGMNSSADNSARSTAESKASPMAESTLRSSNDIAMDGAQSMDAADQGQMPSSNKQSTDSDKTNREQWGAAKAGAGLNEQPSAADRQGEALTDSNAVKPQDTESTSPTDEPMAADRKKSAQENDDSPLALKMAPNTANAEQSVPSDNGLLFAEVVTLDAGRMQVVVRNENREQVFVSSEYEAEQISNIQWSKEDTLLEFDLMNGDSQNHILIDVANKIEVQK